MTSYQAGGLSFNFHNDSIDLQSASCSFSGVVATIVTTAGKLPVTGLALETERGDPEEGLEIQLSGSCELGQIRLRVGLAPTEPVAFLRFDLSAVNAFDLRYVTFSGQVSGPFDRFWKQGWQSWSPAYVTPLAAEDDSRLDDLVSGFGEPATGRVSFDVGLLAGPQSSLCAGFLSADRFLGCVTVEGTSFACSWLAGNVSIEPGEVISLEPLRIELSDDPEGALPRYGAAVADATATSPAEEAFSGWCSWYYYYTRVREDDVVANLRFLEAHRRELPVDFVQLDDGYQSDIGDWRGWNDKFPGGPKHITEEIHGAGLKAGLWLAPFLAGANSRLAIEHPDWLVRNPAGEPVVAVRNWDQANYALDLTNPAVQDWLQQLLTEIFDDWGFDYVKIDFVFAAAIPGVRMDRRRTPIEAYREGLAIVRRAAGERFVLGCGALQLASVGLVDAMRVGPDVAPWWRARGPRQPDGSYRRLPRFSGAPAAEASIRNALQRSWMHRRLWLNDPDCILARDTQTRLTATEVQSLATVIGLSAGLTVLSDNMPELSESSLRILSFILPPLPAPAAVRNALDSDLPDRIELDAGERLVVALFNWDEEERDLTLRLTRAEVFDVWAGRYLGPASGELLLPAVPAHGCRLLTLSPADERPRLLATSFHVGQGIHEIESEPYEPSTQALTIRLNPTAVRTGSLWFRWPHDSVHVEGSTNHQSLKDGILHLDLTLDQPTELTLRP